MAKVRIMEGDGWTQLYVDGEFVESGHEIRTGDLLKAIGVDYEIVFGEWDDDTLEWTTHGVERNGESLRGEEVYEVGRELDGSIAQ